MATPLDRDELTIDLAKVCTAVAYARAFEGGIPPADPNDDGPAIAGVADTVQTEAMSFFADLNDDEQYALVALAWLGRGTFGPAEWQDALRTARREHNEHTGEYLLGMPLCADYLESGLEAFDLTCADFEDSD